MKLCLVGESAAVRVSTVKLCKGGESEVLNWRKAKSQWSETVHSQKSQQNETVQHVYSQERQQSDTRHRQGVNTVIQFIVREPADYNCA